jgi:hypothetical protein
MLLYAGIVTLSEAALIYPRNGSTATHCRILFQARYYCPCLLYDSSVPHNERLASYQEPETAQMRRMILKVAPLVLAFLLGVFAKVFWDNRHQIYDVWANLFLYYQD